MVPQSANAASVAKDRNIDSQNIPDEPGEAERRRLMGKIIAVVSITFWLATVIPICYVVHVAGQ